MKIATQERNYANKEIEKEKKKRVLVGIIWNNTPSSTQKNETNWYKNCLGGEMQEKICKKAGGG